MKGFPLFKKKKNKNKEEPPPPQPTPRDMSNHTNGTQDMQTESSTQAVEREKNIHVEPPPPQPTASHYHSLSALRSAG
eukprot:CAMPEP_0119572184 /NCGR_PEP_ID=MMETSP1352-20130426/44494_1 /TAXON_ID=265584 /ORGANISM="Stauroneis constricta, Strain CCMP1120" /LENGTH=77 /DNA_ID=CAMNT_0007621869 /DNA_START=253 /DNA_END=486 /DNA_ORIENTATION=+